MYSDLWRSMDALRSASVRTRSGARPSVSMDCTVNTSIERNDENYTLNSKV